MIAISVIYEVKPGRMDAVLEALARMRREVVVHEPACSIYQVSKVDGAENRLFLYEVYNDAAALQAHGETPHFQAIIKNEVIPMLDNRERTSLQVVIV